MPFEQPGLPFAKDALAPHMSEETLNYHYGKHHAAYLTNLNKLIEGNEFEKMTLENIILNSSGSLFNNAAQFWNHSFFWNCLTPNRGGHPSGRLSELINNQWGNTDKFKEEFNKQAISNFGSGWTWLVLDKNGNLEIMNTANAQTPMTSGKQALLTIDIWEHAYYIDYRNARANFITAFWNLVNWDFVNKNVNGPID